MDASSPTAPPASQVPGRSPDAVAFSAAEAAFTAAEGAAAAATAAEAAAMMARRKLFDIIYCH